MYLYQLHDHNIYHDKQKFHLLYYMEYHTILKLLQFQDYILIVRLEDYMVKCIYIVQE